MLCKFLSIIVLSIAIVSVTNIEGRVYTFHYSPGAPAYNAVTATEAPNADAYFWFVGENGTISRWKFFENGVQEMFVPTIQNAELYDFTGISFPTMTVGYLVGYRNSGTDKWKGAIWTTTDTGRVWTRVPEGRLPTFYLNIPFLNVYAASVDVVWVTCGHGWVIRSYDAGYSWYLVPKPGVGPHSGWFWGLWAQGDEAWVCADQSRLIAMTTNSGLNWTNYYPFCYEPQPSESLPYADMYKRSYGYFWFAGSKKIVGSNAGLEWFIWNLPFGTSNEWVRGVANDAQDWLISVGAGGTFARGSNTLDWFTKRCDFNDVATFSGNDFLYNIAVGTKRSILIVYESWPEDPPLDDTTNEGSSQPPVPNFQVYNHPDPDHGWKVKGEWSHVSSAYCYRIYAYPAPNRDLSRTPPPANQDYYEITRVYYPYRTFVYDSILNGKNTAFWIKAYNNMGNAISSLTGPVYATPVDESSPPPVTNLTVDYNLTYDVVVLNWDAISLSQEPNFGGYWVCPDIYPGQDENINHQAALLRNYYIESIPAGRPRPFEWEFKVQAMDMSSNRGGWSNIVRITIPRRNITDSPYSTAFNQGRHLVRFPEDKMLYMVYENDGEIMYAYSQDNGAHWSEEEIGNGYFPSIGIDHKGYPWIAYWKDGDIVCKVKRPSGTWKVLTAYDGNGTTTWAGAPAIAMGTIPEQSPGALDFAYITYTIYEGSEMPDMPSNPPYPSTYSCIKLSILDTLDIANYSLDEGDGIYPVDNPAIAVTPADYIHLVWGKEGEIWYSTNILKITPYNWQNVQMEDKINISVSSEILSQHPFVESYGENVYVAWKEGEPGEIFRRIKLTPFSYWGATENISNSPDQESDYPVLATSDVVVYQEKVDANNSEIYAWINDEYVNLSETEKSSKYPHIVVEPPLPTQPEILIDAIWTEEITQDELYEVKFKRYIHPTNPDSLGAYLSVTTGDSVASPYCEHRDGFVHYGPYSLDYANSSLIYILPYLHPKSNYLLKAKVYHALTGRWREKMFADSILGADVYFDPNVPTMVNILLPKESYANDFEIRKEIQRWVGRYAVITDFKIYEVSLPDSGGGGGQSAGSARILKTILYQNSPNPFNTMTEISFGLAKEGNVSFLIFDASGRMVRRLINDKLKPGIYNIRWDGKDDEMRNLAQGVYFYRLKTENYIATKKMTLLK